MRGGETEKRGRRDSSSFRPVSTSPRRPVSTSPRLVPPVITLLTDFGSKDYFVGAVKGAIVSVNPRAHIVDITHEVPPQDIEAAAFTLLAAYSTFPAGTIHVAVVDPGVGSDRQPLILQAGGYFFVGPDNGIFSYICDGQSDASVFQVTNAKYFRHPVSATFHGRDVFGPVAATLSNGVKPEELGTKVKSWVQLKSLKPETLKNGKLRARIIHIDRFGNCITNITQNELTSEMISHGVKLSLNGTLVQSFRNFFFRRTREAGPCLRYLGKCRISGDCRA